MNDRATFLCDLHLSDAEGDHPQTVRRSVSAELQIEGQKTRLRIEGSLIGVPGQGMAVEEVRRDDFGLSEVRAKDLLGVVYQDMIGTEEPKQCSASTISGEVRLGDTCAQESVIQSLKDENWH